MDTPPPASRTAVIVRWLLVLPGSATGALIAYAVFVFIRWFVSLNPFSAFFAPGEFIGRLFFETASNSVLGLAAVHIGVLIAPSRKRQTSIALAVLYVLAAGGGLLASVVFRNWWAAYGAVFTAVGTASALSEHSSSGSA